VTTEKATTCSTCGLARSSGEFYANFSECKPCKRQRSQGHRAAATVKVALADRLLAVLEHLASQGLSPEALVGGHIGDGFSRTSSENA
jgi:hypothetical protein